MTHNKYLHFHPHQKYSGGADSLKVPGPYRAQVGKLGGQGDILIPFSFSICSKFPDPPPGLLLHSPFFSSSSLAKSSRSKNPQIKYALSRKQ